MCRGCDGMKWEWRGEDEFDAGTTPINDTKRVTDRIPRQQRSRSAASSASSPTGVLTSTSTFVWTRAPKEKKGARSAAQLTNHQPTRLLDLSSEQLRDVVHARARRRFNRGLKRKPMGLIKKLRKAKQEAKPNEKPDLVKTHLRNMIIVPEMIGSVVGIYSGKEFNQVEIKPEMVGHYLAEFSIS